MKITRYEKIKNSSIKEMAEILPGFCHRCAYENLCIGNSKLTCKKGKVKWLKQEWQEVEVDK